MGQPDGATQNTVAGSSTQFERTPEMIGHSARENPDDEGRTLQHRQNALSVEVEEPSQAQYSIC
jgi:hypothetical protein